MGRTDDKYMWTSRDFENWIKQEVKRVRENIGVTISPAKATRLLRDRILIPRNITLCDVFKPIKKENDKKK